MTFEYLLTSVSHSHYFHIKITTKLELKCKIIIIVVIAFISIVEINFAAVGKYYQYLSVSKGMMLKYSFSFKST